MKCNIGNSDRIFRFIMGAVIIVMGILFNSWWGLVGLIPLGTAFMRFCPLYVPFGISTDKTGSDKN